MYSRALRGPFAGLLISFVLGLGAAHAEPAAAQPLRTEPLAIFTHDGVKRFKVEIADTDATRERGLMFRKSLPADGGMLFDFQTPQTVSFWMKNTLIPLDMVFIGEDGRVVRVTADAKPMSEALIPSGEPVRAVLELAGGRAAEAGIHPGDKVRERIFEH